MKASLFGLAPNIGQFVGGVSEVESNGQLRNTRAAGLLVCEG
jgi:hypothetical protein